MTLQPIKIYFCDYTLCSHVIVFRDDGFVYIGIAVRTITIIISNIIILCLA